MPEFIGLVQNQRSYLESLVSNSNNPTIVMPDAKHTGNAKHPRMRTTTGTLGKQTGLLCFGDSMSDAHPGIPSWPKDSQHYAIAPFRMTSICLGKELKSQTIDSVGEIAKLAKMAK